LKLLAFIACLLNFKQSINIFRGEYSVNLRRSVIAGGDHALAVLAITWPVAAFHTRAVLSALAVTTR
jgi:hypothetical protein